MSDRFSCLIIRSGFGLVLGGLVSFKRRTKYTYIRTFHLPAAVRIERESRYRHIWFTVSIAFCKRMPPSIHTNQPINSRCQQKPTE
uniref:Putative secreted peptide n=1 Tax=Anopheles braziliensis TaxID=58242 RepID=A0A2M3ZMP6_9DIPT